MIARNPEPGSSLPYLLRLPLPGGDLVLKARDTWPRTAKVYCHRADGWPEQAEIVEEVPVRSCVRRGVAIDLVLDRPRENRSQLVFTRQRATTTRRPLPAGDYGVELDGEVVAVVERKSLADLCHALVDGSFAFAAAELAAVQRAAVVVEDTYAAVFRLTHVPPRFVADLLARVQARYPAVPIAFCDNRRLAEEWTFRFLGAALAEVAAGRAGA